VTTAAVPWRQVGDALELRVRLTPKAASDDICGLAETPEGIAIKARVRALPADGAANAAVEKLVAKWLGIPKTAVSVAHGGKSRVKVLAIRGDMSSLTQRLEHLWQDLAQH
jgi:uncharacterized protein YggU (UPF0235/DUF167 family)